MLDQKVLSRLAEHDDVIRGHPIQPCLDPPILRPPLNKTKFGKLPSVMLMHACGTNSHNWGAKGQPGVGEIYSDPSS